MTPSGKNNARVDYAEPEAWGGVFDACNRPIYYLCLRMLGDPTRAEDATQDVFVKAFQSRKRFQGTADIRTWLYRIAINHCKNLNSAWHQRTIHSNAVEEVWENSVTGDDYVYRILEIRELGETIQKTLDAIPEEYRILLLLVADEELSYEQVAQVTGQTVDAIRGKLYRARRAFAVEFDKHQ
ncbi:MAG: RNA polymerase sigma factor [Verrucomicrobiae bacterium]|nr:RNA polymerase sigma factor [Verrucomicrobiae bacterium]